MRERLPRGIGGITECIPFSFSCSRNLWVLWALSARTNWASIHWMRGKSWPMSERGTRCNNDSDWDIIRIHGQVYFDIKPPLYVYPLSWLSFFVPAACGCTLQWVESIISHTNSGIYTSFTRVCSHVPLSRQRQKRRCVFFQSPYSVEYLAMELLSAKSKKRRWQRVYSLWLVHSNPPHFSGKSWVNKLHTWSEMSWRYIAEFITLLEIKLHEFYLLIYSWRHALT